MYVASIFYVVALVLPLALPPTPALSGLEERFPSSAPVLLFSQVPLVSGNRAPLSYRGRGPHWSLRAMGVVSLLPTGCGHCKKMKPEFESAAEVLHGEADVSFLS